jgi:DNA-binding transcriptional MerR regulator
MDAVDEFLCASDVARMAGVSADLVRYWSRRGRLATIRTAGGVRLFHREDVHRVIAERAAKEPAGAAS